MSMDQVDAVVIGAGVVGLAVARALALKGREVLVLEAQSSIGMGVSSRNSEVIHAGIYYEPGSWKARLCVRGKQMLYAYCAERQVPHQRCGKLIVATAEAQRPGLRSLLEKGLANGVDDLQLLDASRAQAMEPEVNCVEAVWSPSTGIVDAHSLMMALYGDLEQAGGMAVFHAQVTALRRHGVQWAVHTADGTALLANTVVNAAALGAVALARATEGLPGESLPEASFAKGNYFSLSGKSPFSHLVYPVPDPEAPPGWLGVHLTLDLGGQARFGPDLQWSETPEALEVDLSRQASFEQSIRGYWPGLPANALQPAYAGMRPKIHGPGEPAPDFRIDGPAKHGLPGLVNLLGIESPGLTSSMAIAEHVAGLC